MCKQRPIKLRAKSIEVLDEIVGVLIINNFSTTLLFISHLN